MNQYPDLSKNQKKEIAFDWFRSQSGTSILEASTYEYCKDQYVNKYEQELWDKVATRLFCEYVAAKKECCYFKKDHATKHACEYADAFMAERAKRIKGGS